MLNNDDNEGLTETITDDATATKPKRVRKPAAKKGKKAKAKKPAAKKTAKKSSKGNGAAKATGPREGSISAMVVAGIKAGKTRDAVVKEIAKKFPDSEFTENGTSFFSWYRWNAVRKGWLTQAQADKTSAKE